MPLLRRFSIGPAQLLFVCFCLLFVLIGLERGGGKIASVFEPLLGLFSLYLLFKRGAASIRADGLLIAAFIAYCGYYLLRWHAWDGSIDASVDMFRPVTQAILMVALLAWWGSRADAQGSGMLLLVLLGSLVAGVSLFNFYVLQGNGLQDRLRPLGEASHPIIGMYYYAFPLLLAGLLFRASQETRVRLMLLLCAAVLLSVFLLSRSRGPLLGLIVTTGTVAFFGLAGRARVLVFGGGAAAVLLFLLLQDADWLSRLDTGRFVIWEAVFEQLPEALWLGHGSSHDNYVYFSEVYGWQHAHNIWLGHLYWGGAVAALLLAAVYGRAVWLFYRFRGQPLSMLGLLLVCFGLVSMLTDGNLLLASPDPLWFVFVVPVGLAIGLSARPVGQGEVNGTGADLRADV